MKKALVRKLSHTQLALRAAVITSVSFVVLLFSSCDTNAPSSQGDLSTPSGSQHGSFSKTSAVSVSLGTASTFAVMGAAGVTNAAASVITGDLGVGPGAIEATGFQPEPLNTIEGPGTVTAGLGLVNGTIYAGGPVAIQAHNDAVIAYDFLVAQVPDAVYGAVYQLDGDTITPGIYSFPSSANLQVGGTLYLDFQGNNDAQFIFQLGSTLVTMADSRIIALNSDNQTCIASNVYWAVGSSATIDGAQFLGTVIAKAAITMTSAGNLSGVNEVSGRMFALVESVTMVNSLIAVCGSSDSTTVPPKPCRDFVTGGGWIKEFCIVGDHYKHGKKHSKHGKKRCEYGKATFGVSGGIIDGKFWGQLSFNDHGKNGVRVKSTKITAYIVIDAVTRQIEGIAKINGRGSYTFKVIVADNGRSGRNDSFSIELSNGYSASGTLKGGNIQLHKKCAESRHHGDKEDYDDKDEKDGHHNCDNDRGWWN